MSTKDFKEGMVAGAKPFGDKLDQLADVSESAVLDIKEGLGEVNEVVNILIDDAEKHDGILSAYEKKRIYDLDQATDISALEDNEKEFLVAVLAELANSVQEVTELQKRYILSVCSTVGIATPQTSLDFACIENIENMRTQKIILRHVMEFFFIGSENYGFLNEYDDTLFCYFSINKHGIDEIVMTVDRIYNAMGIEGIANRYTFVAGYTDIFADDVSEIDDNDADSYVSDEYVPDVSEFEELILSGVVSVQGSTEYKYKKVTINAAFAVNGELIFDNCFVHIEKDASFNVVGTLTFESCEITYGEKYTADNYAISSVDGGKVVFSDCVLKNGQYFLNATGDVVIEKCSVIDCDNFIYAHSGSTTCSIKVNDSTIAVTGELCGYGNRGIFSVSNYTVFEVHNLKTIVSSQRIQKFRLFDVQSSKGIIDNAEIESSVIYAPGIVMNQCSVRASVVEVAAIENSLISQSEISCVCKAIDRCDFTDMKENTVETKGISNCTFNNISCKTKRFLKTTALINNCIFSNVDLGNGNYLIEIAVDSGSSNKSSDVLVTNCRFINCYTDRADKKIITGYEIQRKSTPNKIVPFFVNCNNCTGLNQVNGGDFKEIKVEQQDSAMSKGAKIGVVVGAVIPGLGAIVGGAVGAFVGAVVDGTKETETANNSDNIAITYADNIMIEWNIRKCIEDFLLGSSANGTLADKLSTSEKTSLLSRMANSSLLIPNDIIGIYDASIMNVFTGNHSGILFLRDRICVKLSKSNPVSVMKYVDMKDIAGTLSKQVITGKDGKVITLNGISYATEEIQKLFNSIIALIKQNS